MKIIVDTSVWSLLLNRKKPTSHPALDILKKHFKNDSIIYTTGFIYQELIQGIRSSDHRKFVEDYFLDLVWLTPDRTDHHIASQLYLDSRKKGKQIGTIDTLLAALSIKHKSVLLSTDKDFIFLAKHHNLKLLNYNKK